MVEITLIEERKPAVVKEDEDRLRCPICGKTEWTDVYICSECGQVYHKWDLDFIKANSPGTRCANRFCPGRKKGTPLTQTARALE
jgi:DNA-directed RNA polymerase subunit RPC12/RpoP